MLPPPQSLLRSHQQFKKKLRTTLRIGKNDVRVASTKEELKQQIEVDPRLIAQHILDDTSKAQDNYTVVRKHGRKKSGQRAQKFTKGFSQFVGAYSGIIYFIKTASGPYGEIAYQTLAIFLIVRNLYYYHKSDCILTFSRL